MVGLLVIFAFPLFMEQITEISRELPMNYGNFRNALFQSSSRILTLIATQMPADIWVITRSITGNVGEPLTQVTKSIYYVGLVTRGAFIVVAILVLGFYWTLESERYIRSLLLWVPTNRRDQFREYFAEIEEKVGSFILGQSILCLSIGVMALVAYQLIGLPYAFVLAVIAAIMEAVPIIGPALGAIPALLVAFPTDPTKALWVIIASLLIQGLENYLLVPRVMKRSVGVNPLVTLLAIAAFTSLFGLFGAILSIPVVAIIQLSINRFILQPSTADVYAANGRDQLNLLRYEAQNLTQDLRKQLLQSEQIETPGNIVDSLESIARDLDLLLTDTEQKMSEN
jgi:predicted PurR-regulated permease PerM